MMSNRHRPFLTHLDVGPSNKRTLDGPKPPLKKPSRRSILRPNIIPQSKNNPAQRNHLLAGYLAHEFLTKGCLFGEPWDPARAEAVPVSADSRREKQVTRAKPSGKKRESYVAVADLLKTDGVQLSGVVNPTELARFLQL